MAARPHRWRRILLWPALTLLLVCLAASGYAWHLWQRLQQEQGIVALDWQGLALSRHGLRLEGLQLEQQAADGRRLRLAADAVRLDWQLLSPPRHLERLHIVQLQLDWQAADAPTGQSSRLPSRDELAALLAWLPRQLQLQRIDARLPCPSAPCRLRGSLALQQPGAALLPASLNLELQEDSHRLRLAGSLDGQPDDARLQLALELDGQPHLAVAARLGATDQQRILQGSLQLPARPPTPWLQQWLAPMLGAAVQPLEQLPAQLQLDAEWTVQLPSDWQPQAGLPPSALLEQAQLQARLPVLRLGDLDLHEPTATLSLRGRWQDQHLLLDFAEQSRLGTRRLDGPDGLRLDAASAELGGLQLQRSADGALRLDGPLTLGIARLQQDQLRPQGWRWQGQLAATPELVHLDGRLGNDAGLAMALQLRRPASGDLDLQFRTDPIVLAGANPLAATLSAWPALLEPDSGRLSAHGSLRLPADDKPVRANLQLQLRGLGGISDRSELRDLDARLDAELRGRNLYLELPELHLASLNPGIPLGPLQLRADYQTTLDAPLAGRLQLWQAEAGLLGGQLRSEPARLDLSRPPQRLVLHLRGLQLAELLRTYPAEGLSGNGILDGRLPLEIGTAGLQVDRGRVEARPPGGTLQLRSERIRAFARGNPALQLVTTALEDFRYDRLESEVSYAPQGQLLLALHLHGNNPALEGGRPVNLSINLEENVPALLTSLQLSGRVNEAIQRRVQQRLSPRQ